MKGRFMKNLSLIIVSLVFLASCSKEVGTKSSLNLTPNLNPVIEVPSNQNSGSLNMNFANHATVRDVENEYSRYQLSEPLLLKLPLKIQSYTYASSMSKPVLTLVVNDVSVCNYSWTGTEYVMASNCYKELDLTPNDVVELTNIPKSQTVSVLFQYQR